MHLGLLLVTVLLAIGAVTGQLSNNPAQVLFSGGGLLGGGNQAAGAGAGGSIGGTLGGGLRGNVGAGGNLGGLGGGIGASLGGGVNLPTAPTQFQQDQPQPFSASSPPTTQNRFGGGLSAGLGLGGGGLQGSIGFNAGTTVNDVENELQQEWSNFKSLYNKTYASSQDEAFRREIYIENRNKVSKFNQGYATGLASFVQKINSYGDFLHHEFHNLVNGFNRNGRGKGEKPARRGSYFIPSANVVFPSYVDWREAGAVTPVKSQGTCAGCYAFSAAGALEGHYFRKSGQLIDLSPQNLIDCTRPYGNNGCSGGLMSPSFEYVRDNRGIDTEGTYPFEQADKDKCRYRQEGYGTHDTGYVDIDEGDERRLESAVATIGPVSVAIDAGHESFQFYSNGIYYEPNCQAAADKVNHAVLVVGYGSEPSGEQYWLVKNSYGPEWGIGGYIKMPKFRNNHCGIATYASYPLV